MPAVNPKITLACEECGKQFKRYPSELTQKHHFCSRKCGSAWRSQNQSGDKWPSYKKQQVPCAQCGATLLRTPNRIGNQKQHFCDKACHGQWISINQTGENALRWGGGKVQVSCATCGKTIERIRYEVEERSERFFCDPECRGVWQSENKVGEAHPNWKGGWEPYYGPNWHDQRAKARERDGHKCQSCGITKKKLGKELDVHHIKPFHTFGYVRDKNDNHLQANELSNLTTLCPSCHHRAEWGTIPIKLPLF